MNKTFHISNKKPNPSPIFLKSSHHVTKKVIKPTLDSSKDTEIHLNPNLIKHFMSKNDFYYDIKTWKARRGKVDKESKYSFTGRCGFIPKQKFLDIISLGKYVNSNDQRIVDKEFEIFSCNFIKDDIILNGNARNSNYNQLLKQYMKDQSHSKPNKSTTNNIYRLFKPGEIPN